ncbi:NADP(H)-dependent aldo-keto reductase [Pigmentiphaga soli]|uniref:NADP(H)-dependent aldo-keto reductase n=1 Tax=Pigmentiphaga soli TaxID=1007095 RepID=A0ABP8GQA6_9BURK
MKKTKLGTTRIDVSAICLGTMTFGQQNTEAEGHAQLDRALAAGINFIDTAEMYPAPPSAETYTRTEQIVGTWLKKQPRDRVVLASKVAGPSRGRDWIRGGRYDADCIRAAIEGSLRRLQTDYLDLYQIHWPARNVPVFGQTRFDPAQEREAFGIEEQLRVFDDLIRAGKIRHLGVSNESAYGVMEFLRVAEKAGLPRIATIQNACSLLNRSFEQALDEVCFRTGVGLLAYGALAAGQLSGKYARDAGAPGRLTLFPQWSPRYMRGSVLEAARRYEEIARSRGLDPAQMALAWCYSRWYVNSTIIGATSLQQLEAAIGALDIRLDDETLARIDAVHAEIPNPAQ